MKKALQLLFALFSLSAVSADSPPLYVTSNGPIIHEACGGGNGSIDINVAGGTPPYVISWSNGAITQDLTGLSAGTYTITVTDAILDQATQTYTINDLPNIYPPSYPAQDGHFNCPGHCWGEFRVIDDIDVSGTPPFTYSEPLLGYDLAGYPFFQVPGGACGNTTFTMTMTDANGCSGDMTVGIGELQAGAPAWTITNVGGSCTGTMDGSVMMANVHDAGGTPIVPEVNIYNSSGTIVLGQTGTTNMTFNGLAPGHYYAHRDWNPWGGYQYTAYPCDDDTLGFDIPDLGAACGTVSGKVFIDNDQDCTQDPGEVSVPYSVLEILPGPEYAITDQSGDYSRALADASYTMGQTDPTLIPVCPATQPVPFTMNSLPVVIDFADSSTVPLDLSANSAGQFARPGFNTAHQLQVKNLSPQISGPVTATLVYDPTLTFLSATPIPTNVVGNTLTWSFAALTGYQQQGINIQYNVPIPTPLGTQLTSTFSVSNTLLDANASNDASTINQTVTGSYDPNDKLVTTSSGYSDYQYFIGTDQWLDYTIRFQNTGTDTAFTVAVTDSLDADLDIATFEQGLASHPFSVEMLDGRVVKWTFNNILLPDSGTNESASHGLVSFRIKPVEPLAAGTIMTNNADIFFDFNTPIRTNDAEVISEISTTVNEQRTSTLSIFPNPTAGLLQVTLPADMPPMVRVELTDLRGQVMLKRDAVNTRTIQLDLIDQAYGLYLIVVHCSDGSSHRGRVVLN